MKEFKQFVKKLNTKHLDRYLGSRASSDIQNLGVMPIQAGAKEVTESMAIVDAANKYFGQLDNVDAFIIGDGYKPRMGVMLAFFGNRNWNIHSIDPTIINGKWEGTVSRLSTYRTKIEDFNENVGDTSNHALLLLPHSHASVKKSIYKIKALGYKEISVISMPCCFSDNIGDWEISYVDEAIINTPKNVINIYFNV